MSAYFFHRIAGIPVFLTDERGAELTRLAVGSRDSEWRLAMHLRDGRERREARKLERRFLSEELRSTGRAAFEAKWSKFDLEGDSARENVFRAISAFAVFNRKKMGFRDHRYFEHPFGEWMREEESDPRWPHSKEYGVIFYCRHHHVELPISTEDVQRLRGTLVDFLIESQSFLLRCSRECVSMTRRTPAP